MFKVLLCAWGKKILGFPKFSKGINFFFFAYINDNKQLSHERAKNDFLKQLK